MAVEKTVVITGASTGIGRACALHMDALGWSVFAGVRNETDAESLRREASTRLHPVLLDVTDAHSINGAREAVERATGASTLSGLVNNAGVAYGGPVELLDVDELRSLFEVNFFGLLAVTQAFLPLLRKGRGRIVNMSSISGMVASPFLSPYSTSKWALEALSNALRVELHPWDIKVAVIQPGAIDTPIWRKGQQIGARIVAQGPKELAEYYGPALDSYLQGIRPHGISVKHVARAVEHALTSARPRLRYPVGKDAALVRLFRHLPDRVLDAFFRRRLQRGR